MKKKQQIEFVLKDTGNLVQATLADRGQLIFDYENEEAKAVRVRVPVPTKEKIIESAKYWMSEDDRWKSVDDQVNFYICCREKNIFEQIQEIRKCVKRIRQYTICAKVAREALQEYHSRET